MDHIASADYRFIIDLGLGVWFGLTLHALTEWFVRVVRAFLREVAKNEKYRT